MTNTTRGGVSGARSPEREPDMHAIYSNTTHGRFIEHMDLARAWARWHGQRGTEAQILKVMYRLDLVTLRRMLFDRGVKAA